MSTNSRGAAAPQPAAYAALIAGAVVWGLIWYPYRLLEAGGTGGVVATVLTYSVAFAAGLVPFERAEHVAEVEASWWLPAIGLSAGGCNLGYVLGTLEGEVMRVLLLFYLSPLWTVLFSRLLLDERLGRAGAGVIALSLAGAGVMLWRPELGAPWPGARAEWIGLAAGALFALSNVLIRKTHHLPIDAKCLAVFLGAVLLGVMLIVTGFAPAPALQSVPVSGLAIVVGVGLVLLAINLIVQFGLTHTPANQAIVIFLFELVVAAVSSWLLAGERMSTQEWIGGAMIIAASLFSGHVAERPPATS
ncbi:MAG TPA: DMT family transporter [Rhodocyclaceae bacterium]|nr:DMT family transporter [Rhodocyclaceae bacterium]